MTKITQILVILIFSLFTTSLLSFKPSENIKNEIKTTITDFNISPNPAKDKVDITFNQPLNTNICIHDNLGNIVFEIPIENELKIQLILQDLVAGIYFVSVKTETKTLIKRLIKY